jgi:hypothetical protein
MNTIQIGDRVKFQRPDTASCCDASVAWIAGELRFIHVPTLAVGQMVRLDVEVVQECDDGIFRRAENFRLDKMDEDVLCTLRESAEAINAIEL